MTVYTILYILSICLTLGVFIYCLLLTRKMRLLRKNKDELGPMVTQFEDILRDATKHINELKALSREADRYFTKHIDKAQFLSNDLSFLTNKGESVATQLENQITTIRKHYPPSKKGPMASMSASTQPHHFNKPVKKEEPSDTSTPHETDTTHTESAAPMKTHPNTLFKKQELEAVLEQITTKKKQPL